MGELVFLNSTDINEEPFTTSRVIVFNDSLKMFKVGCDIQPF